MIRGTIVGIDPGSTNLGFGVLHVDMSTYQILSAEAFTLKDDSGYFKWMVDQHADRFRRLDAMGVRLNELFLHYQPFLIGSESPFFNRFRPNAYRVLIETMELIRKCVFYYNPYTQLREIPPSNVKNALGALGNAKKEVVGAALAGLSNLHLSVPFQSLDEHAVDALGVAYATYKQFLGEMYEKSF